MRQATENVEEKKIRHKFELLQKCANVKT